MPEYRVEKTGAFIGGRRVGPDTNFPTVNLNGDEFEPWPDWLVPVEQSSAPTGAGAGDEVRASKAAAELADEYGVDLSNVEGSGSGGRITKGDVEAYIAASVGQREGDDSEPPDDEDDDEA